MAPRQLTKELERLAIVACITPLAVLYVGVKVAMKAVHKARFAIRTARNRRLVMTRRLPKSKPLATGYMSVPIALTSGTPTSFLHLPPEIRLCIYRIAFGAPKIVQISADDPFWGPRPDSWDPAQYIRHDEDPPSEALRETIGLGGSGFRQYVARPSRGCVSYGAVSTLICGEEGHLRPGWVEPESVVFYTDLMRTCRTLYDEILDILYAGNTISLFGAEMVRYFSRNASPEGLRRVRFVHAAFTILSSSWDSSVQRISTERAVRTLRESLPALRQLDVEVVLTWGQPNDPQRFWTWLTEDLLGQLHGLQRFTLKISVYLAPGPPFREPRDRWTPGCQPLSSWDDAVYHDLKTRITSGGAGAQLSLPVEI